MKTLVIALLLVATRGIGAEVLDRIAVVIEKKAIKDSDINRDVRLVSLLNGEPAVLNEQTRREAANRMIDLASMRIEHDVLAIIFTLLAADLREESYKSVVIVHSPTVKRMVVTLSALGSNSHKDLSYVLRELQTISLDLIKVGRRIVEHSTVTL